MSRETRQAARIAAQKEEERKALVRRKDFDSRVTELEGLSPAQLRRLAIEKIVAGEQGPVTHYWDRMSAYSAQSLALSNLALLGVAMEEQQWASPATPEIQP